MFQHFGCNSLSAFRQKFNSYELDPKIKGTGNTLNTNNGHLNRRWSVHPCQKSFSAGCPGFIGQILANGQKDGLGIFLDKGQQAAIVYIGQFAEGKKNGIGSIITPRGESYLGNFKDDIMYGPGLYCFPSPQLRQTVQADNSSLNSTTSKANNTSKIQKSDCLNPFAGENVEKKEKSLATNNAAYDRPAYRVSFQGLMNGRPSGRGCMQWSDGSFELGYFDGTRCIKTIPEKEIRGIQACVQSEAKSAQELLIDIIREVHARGLWSDAQALFEASRVLENLEAVKRIQIH